MIRLLLFYGGRWFSGRLMIRLLLILWRKMVLWSSNDKTTFIFMEEDGFVVV